MPVPDALLDRQRGWVTLASGLELYLELRTARDLAQMGGMSWPLLEAVGALRERALKDAAERLGAKGKPKKPAKKPTPEERETELNFQKALVAATITRAKIDGEEHDLSDMGPDDLAWMDEAEFNEAYAYADRMRPLKAGETGKAPRLTDLQHPDPTTTDSRAS